MYKGLFSSTDGQEDNAWKTIFFDYSDRMYRIAKYITGSDDDAKDVVQQTFKNACERKRPFESRDELGKFLVLKARCNAIDRLRRITAREKHERRWKWGTGDTYTPAYAKDDDDETTYLKEAVMDYLPDLPPQQQKIVHLTFWEGMDKKEVAAFLQLSEFTVRNHLSRALLTLAKKLGIKRNKKRDAARPGQEPEK